MIPAGILAAIPDDGSQAIPWYVFVPVVLLSLVVVYVLMGEDDAQ